MTDEATSESMNIEEVLEELKAIKKFYWQQIERLEERLENHEGLIAILVQGYAELAASAEAVMEVLSNDLETKQSLSDALKNSKDKFLEVLQAEGSPKNETD